MNMNGSYLQVARRELLDACDLIAQQGKGKLSATIMGMSNEPEKHVAYFKLCALRKSAYQQRLRNAIDAIEMARTMSYPKACEGKKG